MKINTANSYETKPAFGAKLRLEIPDDGILRRYISGGIEVKLDRIKSLSGDFFKKTGGDDGKELIVNALYNGRTPFTLTYPDGTAKLIFADFWDRNTTIENLLTIYNRLDKS